MNDADLVKRIEQLEADNIATLRWFGNLLERLDRVLAANEHLSEVNGRLVAALPGDSFVPPRVPSVN